MMKVIRVKFYLLLAMVSLCLLPSNNFSVSAQAQTRRGLEIKPMGNTNQWPPSDKRYALLIGIDRYEDKQISELIGASNDVKMLAETLINTSGFIPNQVIVLSSDQEAPERRPTRVNILHYLSTLTQAVPKDGLLMIAFAGHGMERNGQAFLLPCDARMSNDVQFLEDTALNVTRVKERIKEAEIKQIILFLDSCRNDPFAGRSIEVKPLTKSYADNFKFDMRNGEVTAFATLYATSVGQRAYEYTKEQHGFFMWAVLEGMKGKAANETGEVTLGSLIRYIQETVPKQISIELGQGFEQRPYAKVEGYKADDLVIAITKTASIKSETIKPKTPLSKPEVHLSSRVPTLLPLPPKETVTPIPSAPPIEPSISTKDIVSPSVSTKIKKITWIKTPICTTLPEEKRENSKSKPSSQIQFWQNYISPAAKAREETRYSEAEKTLLDAEKTLFMGLGTAYAHQAQGIKIQMLGNSYLKDGQFDRVEQLVLLLSERANLYLAQRRYDEAEPLYLRAVYFQEKILLSHKLNSHRSNLLFNRLTIAFLYGQRGFYAEAEEIYRDLVAIPKDDTALEPLNRAICLNNLAYIYIKRGKLEKAEALCQESLMLRQTLLPVDSPYLVTTINNLVITYAKQGKFVQARTQYDHAVALQQKSFTLEQINNEQVILDLHHSNKDVKQMLDTPEGCLVVIVDRAGIKISVDGQERSISKQAGERITMGGLPLGKQLTIIGKCVGKEDIIKQLTLELGDKKELSLGWAIEKITQNRILPLPAKSTYSMVFSADNRRVISYTDNQNKAGKAITTWDLESNQEVKSKYLSLPTNIKEPLAFSINGEKAAFVVGVNSVEIWDLVKNSKLLLVEWPNAQISKVIFSPDSRLVAAISRGKDIRVWNVEIDRLLVDAKITSATISSIAISADNHSLLLGSEEGKILLCTMESKKQLSHRQLLGHHGAIRSVTFSSQNHYGLSTSANGEIFLWDMEKGVVLRDFESQQMGIAYSVSFSFNGKRILSAGTDNIIRLWDTETGSELCQFHGHSQGINSVVFSSDARYILARSADGTTRMWEAPN